LGGIGLVLGLVHMLVVIVFFFFFFFFFFFGARFDDSPSFR
jgi:hypothetical protein